MLGRVKIYLFRLVFKSTVKFRWRVRVHIEWFSTQMSTISFFDGQICLSTSYNLWKKCQKIPVSDFSKYPLSNVKKIRALRAIFFVTPGRKRGLSGVKMSLKLKSKLSAESNLSGQMRNSPRTFSRLAYNVCVCDVAGFRSRALSPKPNVERR